MTVEVDVGTGAPMGAPDEGPAPDEATRVVAHLLAGPARLGDTRLVCIDGRAGSGKTTLADAVANALGELPGEPTVAVLHLDDVYRGWSGLLGTPARVRRGVLDPLALGQTGRYRRWDWHRGALAEECGIAPAPYLVIEGVGAGAICLTDLATTSVWVEADDDVRRQRALDRDGEAFRPYWDHWAEQERLFYADERPWTRADLVVSSVANGSA